jgi:magnesium chelatase family protein
LKARALAAEHRRGADGVSNPDLARNEISAISTLEPAGRTMLSIAVERLGLSVRALHRSLKVARTIAYLAGARQIAAGHVAEALSFRQRIGEE